MANVEAEQRASDALSAALGTPAHNVLSDAEAADQISIVLADQAQEQQRDLAEREALAAGKPPPQEQAAIADTPLPQFQPHPMRQAVEQAVLQAQMLGQQSQGLEQQAKALRAAGRAHEAAEALARAVELRDQAFTLGTQAVAAGQQIQAAEQAHVGEVVKARVQIEDHKVRSALGDAWNESAKKQVADYLIDKGYSPKDLLKVNARDVLVVAEALGIGSKRNPAPDNVKARLQPAHPADRVERAFRNRRVRPGTLEAAALQLATGKRISQDRQTALWNRSAAQPKAQPGRPSGQQAEQQIAARLRRLGVV